MNFNCLTDPTYAFFLYAIAGGILSSISLGVVGTYVVTRRITGIAGAIAHCVLGGIGLALFMQRVCGWHFLDPFWGALWAALIAAGVLGLAARNSQEREDTFIGALWAVGMSIGLLLMAKTPGFVDPMVYLFGNILLLSPTDLYAIVGLDIIVLILTVLLYRPFLAVCFDEETAKMRGLPVGILYSLLLMLTALTIVVLIRVVGIVLVIALLTIPAAIAGRLSQKLWQMMVWATFLSCFFVMSGLYLSYQEDVPSGPAIVLIAASIYLLTIGWISLRQQYWLKNRN